jgi:zinc protease
MKKIISVIVISFFAVLTLQAQLDRSVRPQPGPAPEIKLGDFQSFTLNNGLQVIVVENKQVPVVSFQLTLDIDPILEGNAKGYVDFAGQLMREGTKTRTKAQIDQSIDFIGGTLITFSEGMFASSLTRHQNTLLELMADVVLNPVFPQEELQKRISQARSGLQNIKTNGNAIAQNIATATVYGPNHPYGEVVTEETLNNITTDLLHQYYQTYWKPNAAYMVIVGDINVATARRLMNQYFGRWQRGDVPRHTYATPQAPQGKRVAFGERVGAVQSVVQVSYPVVLPVGHPDAIKVDVMNSILGGGVFSGRLMQNLREDKGYTYGARSNISNDRIVGRFVASTEVRNDVTAHTVEEILYEMQRLINEPVDETTVQLVKNFSTGSFARALESPRTIARFALNIKRFNLPTDYYATYLEKLNAVTVADVQEMAQKYLKPDNAVIIVAGNINEVPHTIEKFAANGQVAFFDAFGKPMEAPKVENLPAGVTLKTVIDNYIQAIGGAESLSQIRDIKKVMEFSHSGQVVQINQLQQAPDKMRMETVFGGMVVQTQIFDGQKAAMSGMMGKQEFTQGPEFETMKLQSIMNIETDYEQYGIRKDLEGVARVEGQRMYKVAVVDPSGRRTYEYYDMNTGLKLITESEMGMASYNDYQTVTITKEGPKPGFFARMFGKKQDVETFEVKIPMKITQQAGNQQIEMTVTDIEINKGVDASQFTIN